MTLATECAYRAVGRMSCAFDLFRPLIARLRGGKGRAPGPFDKTGLAQGSRPVEIRRWASEVYVMRYDSLAHSLWRAQELTLLQRFKGFLEPPLADFGCGDGSFGAALFDRIEFGIDNDPEALAVCRQRRPAYRQLVQAVGGRVPLPAASVGGVIANSVLEHTDDPRTVLREIARILRPGGTLLLTVPVSGFARHLERFFGRRESLRVNREYHHRTLVEGGVWLDWLKETGFSPRVVRSYQGAMFTFWYRLFRLLGERGLGATAGLRDRIWNRVEPWLVRMVERSVQGVADGANVFVSATRDPGPARPEREG